MRDKKKTILVVDDLPDDLAILKEILQGEYRVLAATSGAAALAIAKADPPPDLVILDIVMPGMDGFEVCRAIKAEEPGASIPVIFLTAKLMASDESAAFDQGAADFIRKPIEPAIVLARVKAQFEQKDRLVRISEMKYRRLFETAADGIMILDPKSGAIVDANPAMSALLGLPHEAFLNARLADIALLGPVLAVKGRLGPRGGRGRSRPPVFAIRRPGGRSLQVEATYMPYSVNGKAAAQLVLRDVSELVDAERSRDDLSAKLEHYMTTSPAITYSLRVVGCETEAAWVSENISRILGYTVDEAMAAGWWFDNLYAEDRSRAVVCISELTKGDRYTHEYRFHRRDRSVVWIRDELRLVGDGSAGLEVVGTFTDISDLKEAELALVAKGRALESSLEEKSVLLRELHHRVKNNMQVISSMITLSCGHGGASPAEALEAISRRVGAMASVHERFYESPDMARIDFSRFVREMAASALVEARGDSGALDFGADEAMLSVEEAVPAGLAVSELVSNAVRHGSPGPKGGGAIRIRIGLESPARGSPTVRISVSDDGPGLPPGFSPRNATSLGMTLITNLTDQLRGTVSFETGAGVTATLEFPIRGPAAR